MQADTLRKALSTAERANEQLQEENRTTADRLAIAVRAEVKGREREIGGREKKKGHGFE